MTTNPYKSPENPGNPVPPKSNWQKTAVQLVVVVGILGLLVALLLPAARFGTAESARRMACHSHLKQIAIGLQNYESTYGCLPPAYTVDADGKPLHSWRTLILPFIAANTLYEQIDLSKPWDDPTNRAAYETNLPVYHCPSAHSGKARTNYLAIVAPGGCFKSTEPRRASEITDGTILTLMVVEVPDEDAVHWMAPNDASEELVLKLGTAAKPSHPKGFQVVTVNGFVYQLRRNLSPAVLRALISIAGNDDDIARAVD